MNRLAFWLSNCNLPTSELSLRQPLGGGLVLDWRLLRQSCTKQAHNQSVFTTKLVDLEYHRSSLYQSSPAFHRRAMFPSRPLQVILVLLPKVLKYTDTTIRLISKHSFNGALATSSTQIKPKISKPELSLIQGSTSLIKHCFLSD